MALSTQSYPPADPSTSFCECLVSSVLDPTKELSTIETGKKKKKSAVKDLATSKPPHPHTLRCSQRKPNADIPSFKMRQRNLSVAGVRMHRTRPAGCLPLHDNQQALPPGIQVLIDVHDVHDVWALGGPPVQLHLSACLGTVLQHLQGQHLLSDKSTGDSHRLGGSLCPRASLSTNTVFPSLSHSRT